MLKIYECHIKGLTMLSPHVPPHRKGTFLGACDPWIINHIKTLGMNAVQLLPVFESHQSYWGYDTTSWFELNSKYGTLEEFEFMLNTFQSNGIKVILDVVYNHTGTELSDVTYAKIDVTGCGNCVDVKATLPIIRRSMDYWLDEIGVDGMRFDLAGVLGREGNSGFNVNAEFFKYTEKFAGRKILIAEPYDLHEQSLGRYPDYWLELNHHFRDTIRSGHKWKGSSIITEERSVNYICSHDGFCLNDLVSYNQKHNDANGEYNRDGSDDNISWNHGVEGFTYNDDIKKDRETHKQWMIDQLFASKGNILFRAGDETSTDTKYGNNNTWCTDSPAGWNIWSTSTDDDVISIKINK